MILLEANEITFTFPALDREIARLLESFAQETTVGFVRNFREKARGRLAEQESHSWSDKDALKTAREKLRTLSDDAIADAYRQACLAVHRDGTSRCSISFQRTLRLPDDGKVYPLPAGLGRFPLRSVSHYDESAPASWHEKGGVTLPMYQGEALWLSFSTRMPFALKVVSGSINALTGETDQDKLLAEPQNYLPLPDQPWLDGFQVRKGIVRQFVAMPLGAGFTASEQLAAEADAAGLALEAIPMKADRYFEQLREEELGDLNDSVMRALLGDWDCYSEGCFFASRALECACCEDMGLGGGGRIQQEIYRDEHGVAAWDFDAAERLCIHVCNSMTWRSVTGENPPQPPLTAKEYNRYGIPWFDYYRDDLVAIPSTKPLARIKSVDTVATGKGLPTYEGDDDHENMWVIQHGNTRRPEEIRAWGRPVC